MHKIIIYLILFAVPCPSSWKKIEITSNVAESAEDLMHEIMDNIETYLTHGSGLVFRSMVSLDINISAINHPLSQGLKESRSRDTDKVHEQNVSEKDVSKNVTFGHNFEIDISHLFKIRKKSSDVILDVKNTDEKCFLFCVAASLQQHKFRSKSEKENPVNYLQFIDEQLNTDGIDFPIQLDQVEKFVNQNSKHQICINISKRIEKL